MILGNYYNKIFVQFVAPINWKLLLHTTYNLKTDEKVSSLFTKQHLSIMVYFHLTDRESLRDLYDTINESDVLPDSLKPVALSVLATHNRQRNYEVFIPIWINS